jgi:phosphoribosylformimino-5-aminoimidazole carboxamide ribonucleotide (ProFAR) isomerase
LWSADDDRILLPFTLQSICTMGQVVRLAQGDLKRQTVYHLPRSRRTAARCWLEAGARWLHVVNLDGAFENPDQANRLLLRDISGG